MKSERLVYRMEFGSLEELEERLDEEIDRVQTMTDEFIQWANAQREKIDGQMKRQILQGDINISDFRFIVSAMENIGKQSPETIDFLVHTFEQLSQS